MLELEDRSTDAAGIGAMPTERLEHEIVHLAGHLTVAMCRWILLVAEFDRREGYASWECWSCAQWLAWRCGIALNTAREHVRVARALESLPQIAARFADGSLSYSKVRALTRVATPETEADLLDFAGHLTATQLARAMKAYETAFRTRTADDLADEAARLGAQRWPNDDGSVTWTWRVGPETDALMQRAINAVREQDRKAAKAAGEPLEARGGRLPRVDAIALVMEMAIRELARVDTVSTTKTTMTVQVEGRAMVGDDGMVHLDGMVLHPRLAKRLGCDVDLQLVRERDPSDPLNLGRTTRLFTRRQKNALMAMYPTCAFPGCEVPSWMCAFHHIVHWARGGSTDLDNGVPVCARHHWSLHEGGWNLAKDHAGKIVAIAPDGRLAPALPVAVPVPVGAPTLEALNEEAGAEVRPDLNPPYERAGLRFAIDTLIGNHELRYWSRN